MGLWKGGRCWKMFEGEKGREWKLKFRGVLRVRKVLCGVREGGLDDF